MPGPVWLADAGDVGKSRQQPVDQRSRRVAGAGMDDQTGRLVDHDHRLVDVDDSELDCGVGFRQAGDGDRRGVDGDLLSFDQPKLARRARGTVDSGTAAIDHGGRHRSTHVEDECHDPVEPLPRERRRHALDDHVASVDDGAVAVGA